MESKVFGLRKNEEEEIIDNRNISEEVAEEDKNKESRNLSLLGLEFILNYLDNRKRLKLPLYYPRFRIIEKKFPLKLYYLYISDRRIEFDGTIFQFNSNFITEGVHLGVLRLVQNLFVGRNRFRLGRFQLGIIIPFELSIDCDTVNIISVCNQNAVNYSNVVRKVNRLLISRLGSPDDLNCPWVRNVNIVEMYSPAIEYFLPHLPDIPAKTIIAKFDFPKMYDLIRMWCESRNGRVGSQLFIIMWHLHQKFDFNRLVQMGFIAETEQRWRLPMNNNSEAIFSIGDDYDSFRKNYVMHELHRADYYCLEVVNSS